VTARGYIITALEFDQPVGDVDIWRVKGALRGIGLRDESFDVYQATADVQQLQAWVCSGEVVAPEDIERALGW
jgi:hypothetical protein